MNDYAHDSVRLVPAHGDARGRDKSKQEKWLIYCPAIASDTLLYMITQHDSYSLRSYGGRLGVNIVGQHAEGARTAKEFIEMYKPDLYKETSWMELAVGESARWAEKVEREWQKYRKEHGVD